MRWTHQPAALQSPSTSLGTWCGNGSRGSDAAQWWLLAAGTLSAAPPVAQMHLRCQRRSKAAYSPAAYPGLQKIQNSFRDGRTRPNACGRTFLEEDLRHADLVLRFGNAKGRQQRLAVCLRRQSAHTQFAKSTSKVTVGANAATKASRQPVSNTTTKYKQTLVNRKTAPTTDGAHTRTCTGGVQTGACP